MSRIALNDCEPSLEKGLIRRLSIDNCLRFEQWLATVEHSCLSGYDPQMIGSSEGISFEEIDSSLMCEFTRSVTRGKSFFTTKLGYAGLMDYENCAAADEVWILAGRSQPVVLRPEPSKEGCFYVCSEAYVHGVMDSEAACAKVPTLPEDGNSQPVISGLRDGRSSWPQPKCMTNKLL